MKIRDLDDGTKLGFLFGAMAAGKTVDEETEVEQTARGHVLSFEDGAKIEAGTSWTYFMPGPKADGL